MRFTRICLSLLMVASLCFSGLPPVYSQEETDVGTFVCNDLNMDVTDVTSMSYDVATKVDNTIVGTAVVEAAVISYEALLDAGYEEVSVYSNNYSNINTYNINESCPDIVRNVYFWWNTRLCVFSPNVNIYN